MRAARGLSLPVLCLTSVALAATVPACSQSSGGAGAPPAPATGPLGTVAGLPVDATASLQNLSGPVDVVRDKWGRPHIYATSTPDAMRVEGYLVAMDRTMQLEFYRRVSEGRLSEILSDLSSTPVAPDITSRHIGLARAAQAEYAALPAGPLHDAIDAY